VRRALLVALLALLALPAAAAAQDASIQKAAHALASDPVYVDPAAGAKVDAGELRRRIDSAGATPTYIAVVPRTSVSPNSAIRQLNSALGLAGTYILVDGGTLRAGSTDVHGTAEAATKAYRAHWPDVQATLDDLIGRVGDLRGGGSSSGGGGFGGAGAIIILALIALGGLFLLRSRKRSRARQAAEFEEVKENARDDLVALGDDIRALDLDVQMPNAPQAAKDDYTQALE
jgi:hypothetical protein